MLSGATSTSAPTVLTTVTTEGRYAKPALPAGPSGRAGVRPEARTSAWSETVSVGWTDASGATHTGEVTLVPGPVG